MSLELRQHSRPPAVAGQFYPENPQQLSALVEELLAQATDLELASVKALIVPHAGFIYSGAVAASAYSSIQPLAKRFSRVVLMGPSHRHGFQGIATCSATEYRMPFGEVAIDHEAFASILTLPQVLQLDQAHREEHSLEVQLPFLQALLSSFTLVPLVVGDCSAEQVAEVLNVLWGGDETLIVISSDLSHYNSYEQARFLDRKTSEAILTLKPDRIRYQDACGRNPVNGLLIAARMHHLQCKLADLRNSGDTAGNRDQVVGYGAYIFAP